MIKLTKHQKTVIADRINQMITLKSDLWDLMRQTETDLGHDFSDFEEKINYIAVSKADCTIDDIEWFINSLDIDGE